MKKSYNHYRQSKLIEKWDILVGVAIILILLAFLLVVFLPSEGSEVEVFKNGILIGVYPLNENRAFEVGNLRIEIFEGKVSVVEADCPDQLCVHAQAISQAGSTIICVPNRTVVRISGKSEVEGVTQ